jgi:hypothetical protein
MGEHELKQSSMRIDGKNFYTVAEVGAGKKEAEKYAKFLRSTGYLARVIQHPSVKGTYRVYIRRK